MVVKQLILSSIVIMVSAALQLEKSARDRLVHDILDNYHSSVEPSGRIELKFGLSLLCVRIDVLQSLMKTSGWEKYTWSDYRLSWNPKDYDGIAILRLPANLLWKPDIDCYNAIEVEQRTSENIIVESDGSVHWFPRSLFNTLCNVENDTAVCDLSFGSWTYDAYIVNMEARDEAIEMTSYLNVTCPWLVTGHTAQVKTTVYPCCKEPYSSLDVTLELKRN